MTDKSSILITGATGAVGPRVVQALHDAGYHIHTLSLDSPQPGSLPEGVEVRIGDVTDRLAVQSSMEGVEAVIHLAALLHLTTPSPTPLDVYEKVNVGGTATVVDAAIHAGVKRIVFFSTIAVYGGPAGQILTESAPTQPDTFYAKSKLNAEKIVVAARRADGQLLGTVLRFAAIYGPRIKGNYQRLVKALAHRRFLPVGDGSNRRTLIYDRDVAKAVLLAVQNQNAAGKIYNVSDGKFHMLTNIINAICQALGRKPPRISVPVGPIRFAAGLIEDVAHLIGVQAPISRANVDKYVEDVAVDSSRIREELGFQPTCDLLTGWQETVKEMRIMGEL